MQGYSKVTAYLPCNYYLLIMSHIIQLIEPYLPSNKLKLLPQLRLLMTSAPYYILAVLTFMGLAMDRAAPWPFIAIVYSGFPLLDQIFTLDSENPTENQRKILERNDVYYRMSLYAAMIFDWAMFVKLSIVMQDFQLNWSSGFQLIGTIFIASNLSSVQFAVAHQIMHKPGKFYRILGTLHMLKLYYMHFTYHHLHRHHHQVATPNDPSTAIQGETVYQFIPRCVKGSWFGVYQDEKKLGKSIWTNYAVLSVLSSFLFSVLMYLAFGFQSLIINMMIAAGAIIYLQAINYLEHYGLLRKRMPDGSYEKVTILHSWNAPHRFTNYLLFKLQRHSDHHENASKPFQTLLSLEESPLLPHGYNLMVLMTFFPKIWFRVMDPLVKAYNGLKVQDKSKIDAKVKQTSMVETRKFLIEVGLSAVALFWLSTIKIL